VILGLDFGTSTTSVSEIDPSGRPRLLPIGFQKSENIPSVVVEDRMGIMHFGYAALELYQTDSEIQQPITSFKNSITLNENLYESEAEDTVLSGFLNYVLEQVFETSNYDVRNDPNIYLRVSCPAGWNWKQRTRLLNILTNLGAQIENGEVVDEPSAAGVNYLEYFLDLDSEKRILVFDMGGGTLDLAVLKISALESAPTVLSASSRPFAGNKIDQQLTEMFANRALACVLDQIENCADNAEIDEPRLADLVGLSEDKANELMSWIRHRAESLKKSDLAFEQDATIANFLEFLSLKFGSDIATSELKDFSIQVSSEEFEKMVFKFLSGLTPFILKTIQESQFNGRNLPALPKIDWQTAVNSIDSVILAGGMAHVAALRNWVEDVFPGKLLDVYLMEPEHLVAAGLAPRSFTETNFVATSHFRPNFHLEIEGIIILHAYTPLFEIYPGSTDGLFTKIFPTKLGWKPDNRSEVHKTNLLRQVIPTIDPLILYGDDAAIWERDGLTLYPDGNLKGRDGLGNPISWNIFLGTKVDNASQSQKQTIRVCNECSAPNCFGANHN
jgi:molecular chaperone DnaK (HSP70)